MYEQSKMILGKNIRTFRLQRGLRSKELAQLIGITSENMSNIERAKLTPKLDTIYIIAETLHIEPYQLFVDPELPKQNYVLDDLTMITAKLDGNDRAVLNDILSLVIQSMKKKRR